MKKIKVSKNIKNIIYVALLFIGIILAGFGIREIASKKLKEAENISIIYSTVPKINYTVTFNPNNIYEKSITEKGYQYMGGYVNDILTEFKFDLRSNKNNDFKITYNMSSKIEAFVAEQEKEIIIWTKDMEIANSKEVSGANELLISDTYLLDYDEYTAFIKGIIDELKVAFSTRAIVKMDVNVSWIDESGGLNQENYSPTIIVPLNRGYFTISEEGVSPINKELKGITTEVLPVNKKVVGIYVALLIIEIIAFIIIVRKIEVKESISKGAREIIRKKFFDEYGSRLVAVKEDSNTADKIYVVKDALDLVKIADEIERPILYMGDADTADSFYIVDENTKYIYRF